MREFSNHAILSMSDSTMAVSSKYTQDLSVQIVFFAFSCKWFLCFYFWAVIWSYIVELFAALHELASASAHTLLKLASSVRALLKPYGDTLSPGQTESQVDTSWKLGYTCEFVWPGLACTYVDLRWLALTLVEIKFARNSKQVFHRLAIQPSQLKSSDVH